jgi:hypothetical protein
MARDAGATARHDRTEVTTMNARIHQGRRDRSERSLRVEAGQVVCPRRGLLDIEDCWSCPQYRGLADGQVESLICGVSNEWLASAIWALDHEPRLRPG